MSTTLSILHLWSSGVFNISTRSGCGIRRARFTSWASSSPKRTARIRIIIAEAHCSYKKPVQLGDRVEVSVRVSRLGNKSFEIEYLLSVKDDEVAKGRTTQVAYDYQSEKSIAVPIEWRKKIEEFERNT
ncbi:MAG: acyl-CoA thioesterase [Chloroflexi bacterium]|nr:acyl-CoA thioesterase [Chloroflexota bacterium]